MRLRHKIFSGYLTIIALLALIAGYGGISMNRLMGEYRPLVEDGIVVQQALSSMAELFRLQTGNEKRYYVLGATALADQFERQSREMENIGLTMAERLNGAGERAALDHLMQLHQVYAHKVRENMALVDRTRRAKRRGKPVPTPEYTGPRIQAVEAALAELVTLVRSDQEARLLATRQRGDRTATISFTLGLITVLFGLAAAYGMSVLLTRPVRRLHKATEQMAAGMFDHRVPVRSKDEIGDLAAAFNRMAVQLNHLDELKDEFIAYISHELKTPLTSLKEAVALMTDELAGPLTDRQRQLLIIIQEDGLKIERLISELLDLAKMEAGMMPFFKEPYLFDGIIGAALEEMGPVAEQREVRLVNDGGPSARVFVDHSRIRQVVTNLLSNAIKFSPRGGRVVISWASAHQQLVCSVADRGAGIPESAREAIFEKFQQLAPNVLSGMRGTGLGLPIAKKIIESHDGTLWVDCPEQGGSVFRFTLPLVPPTTAP